MSNRTVLYAPVLPRDASDIFDELSPTSVSFQVIDYKLATDPAKPINANDLIVTTPLEIRIGVNPYLIARLEL